MQKCHNMYMYAGIDGGDGDTYGGGGYDDSDIVLMMRVVAA